MASTTANPAVTVETSIVKAEPATVFEATPEAMPSEEILDSIVTVEQYVKTYFAKTPVLAQIAKCESQYRQFSSSGNVLRGRKVPADVGVMQINESYHKAISEKLGYNIYTLDGNLAYAQYLYDKQGTKPWRASEVCWGR